MSDGRLVKLLTNRLSSNQAWRDFSNTVEAVMSANVWDAADAVLNLRDPEAIQEEFNGLLSRFLGISSSVSQRLSTDSQRKLNKALYHYYKGRNKSLDRLLSHVNNTRMEIVPLWTQDYKTFHPAPLGATIYAGGSWYYTPHVRLQINANDYVRVDSYLTHTGALGTNTSMLKNISLGSTPLVVSISYSQLLDLQTTQDLFYEFAPIHLVLNQLAYQYSASANLYVVGGISVRVVPSGDALIPTLNILGGVSERIFH